MNHSKFLKTISSVLCLVLLFVFVVTLPSATVAEAATLTQLQNNLTNLKNEQAKIDAELAQLKKDASSQLAYQKSLNAKIANAQSQLDNLLLQINELDATIVQKEAEIKEIKAQIDGDFEKLKERIRVLYMMGDVSILEILFSAENIADFFSRQEYIKAITIHDSEIFKQLQENTKEIEEEKKLIEQNRETLGKNKTDFDAQLMELEDALAESKRISAEIKKDQAEAEKEAAKLEKERAEADAAIEKWWKDYYAQQANQIQSTGSFKWPLPGYSNKSNITQYYGGSKNHSGIDVSGSGVYGKPIVAADSGKVIKAEWHYGYGYNVTIQHGNGIATFYAHCSKLAVSVGQTVKQGQTIAYVGSTGSWSTGPHLHFGVLINGKTTDPAKYFKLK